tara:strand:+ start:486 stop:2294 length:1809 start_codon:yes stop_codon:yes gene_type:complete
MPKNKNIPIKYTSRDFNSIKKDLIEHAKRYYPNDYNDFSEASFGSMVFDTVSYVGDVLSYYLDYSVNESFIDTAVEFNNVRKHAKNLGYRFAGVPVAFGTIATFVEVPANTNGNGPNTSYIPTLKKGSEFTSNSGTSYMLLEDIDFNDPSNDIIATKFDPTTGQTTHYAIRGYGQISSGRNFTATADLSNSTFEKFRKVRVGDSSITEIVDVTDSDGNRFYEVDYLSQEVVFLETTNKTAKADGVRSILKPYVTARRFVVQQDDTGTYLQFGFGSDDEDDHGLTDPASVAVKMHARNHITHRAIDPTKLLGTDKLGISPQGTTLTIKYKKNDGTVVNASVGEINNVSFSSFNFTNEENLDAVITSTVKASLEVLNEEEVVGSTITFTIDELRTRSKNFFASQNRAVTKMDYEAIAYNMPTKFGQIKRANIINNPLATNKELVMYVISVDKDGNLTQTNQRTKNNLVTWLGQYNSINDIIKIHDAKIVNLGIEFSIVCDKRYDSNSVLFEAVQRLKEKYIEKFYVGEPIYINNIFSILNKTEGVVDVKDVKINNKTSNDGPNYSTIQIHMDDIISQDATYYRAPKNVIFEIKYPDSDIKGTVI